MTEAGHVKDLVKAIEGLHDCSATFERFEHVTEYHDGDVAWEGDVAVFALGGHPSAPRAYAWAEPVPDSARVKFYAVLHAGAVTSAALALRASIMKDVQQQPPRP